MTHADPCPRCGGLVTYLGVLRVECATIGCANYDGESRSTVPDRQRVDGARPNHWARLWQATLANP